MTYNRWTDNFWYINTMIYYLALKRNKVITTILISLRCIFLCERSHTQKVPVAWFHLHSIKENAEINIRTESRSVVDRKLRLGLFLMRHSRECSVMGHTFVEINTTLPWRITYCTQIKNINQDVGGFNNKKQTVTNKSDFIRSQNY